MFFQCNRSKLIVPQPREVQLSHFAVCRTSLVSRRHWHLNGRYGSITGNMQQDTATIVYIYIYIYILCLWFMLAVPHHIKYPISPISTCADSFFGCGPGGNRKGGGPKWRFLTLSSQFPGKGQPPPPVLN